MAGLVPAIHAFCPRVANPQDVDARHKAGHDEEDALLRGCGVAT